MQKIWAFGDSFTDKYILSNNTAYTNWKGYNPKTFLELISTHYNSEIKNFARDYGMDNYTIFNCICDNVHLIDTNDIVIIGWSEPVRFRLVDSSTQKWRTILPDGYLRINRGLPYVNGIDDFVIQSLFKNREHPLWLHEINSWVNIINKALIGTKIIHWSWYNNHRETITEETDNKIIDFHYSEKGHADLADWLINKIEMNESSLPYPHKSIL
jgi:hypothetical protein